MKNRNPWVAALLNAVASGLGHLYVGSARRAFFVLVPFALVFSALGLFHLLSKVEVYLGMFAAVIAIKVFLIVDAFVSARRHPQPQRRWYMNIGAYAGYVALLLLFGVGLTFRGAVFGYETYSLPRDSMAPTLRSGDVVAVDTFAYQKQPVEVDDIILVRTPGDVMLIRRVSAIGETQVEVVADQSGASLVVPKESIKGRVTGVVFSSDLSRIALNIAPSTAN